mmetsp:Transcript_23973/g.36764  ORF Transcript_23973/g.36764 Transcript_23973/m.36764 type:complete len:152 (-) Transcript_23973:1911-2366(-)
MRRKEELKKHIERAKSEQDRQELAEVSFKPNINQMSKYMRRVNNEKPEDFLLKYGEAVKDKKNSQRIENMRKETAGLNFHPKISRVSERIVESKDATIGKYGKFDSLYADAKRRMERQNNIYSACIESECTFQPDTEKTKFFASKNSSMGF